MDFDEDVWVGRLIRSTIENIVKELKEEKGLGEGGTRSPSVESLVILSELPTYDEFATFVRGEIGLKDAKKQGADEKNSGGLSLVVYNSTGPDGRRRQRQDTSSNKTGRFSRFRCLLSSLCCC